ncbi:MAG: Folylpolyglutamate synthase [Chlamydiia bacterium]|nr:Folylpolyglutamate synthase [Chlamydiia bacterium]
MNNSEKFLAARRKEVKALLESDASMKDKRGRIDQLIAEAGKIGLPFDVIHVTGTNGKGSVSNKTAKVLEDAGYKTGLFTSPHLFDFRERIMINHQMIDDDELIEVLKLSMNQPVESAFGGIQVMFAVFFLMSLDYFIRREVDVAVIEVGIGGRFDTTNIVSPLVSVITNIGTDHADVLGDYDKIAWNKAGVIKNGAPVVIGFHARHPAVYEEAKKEHSPVVEIDEVKGDYELENQKIATAVIGLLKEKGFKIKGLSGIEYKTPGRFQIHRLRNRSAPVIFDGAHNIEGIEALFKKVGKEFAHARRYVIFNRKSTKCQDSIPSLLESEAERVYLAPSSTPFACDFNALQKELKQENMILSEDMTESLAKAVDDASKNGGIVIVCGSFYLYGDFVKALESL